MMNILNGGAHADSNVDVQEFMIAPIGAPTFAEALRQGAEVYHALKSVLKAQGPVHRARRRGRLRAEPRLQPRRARPHRRGRSARPASRPGVDIALALDVAATEFYADGSYQFEGSAHSADEMIAYYTDAGRRATRSSRSRTRSTRRTGTAGSRSPTSSTTRVQLVGDDLFVTNPERLRPRHRAEGAANALLVKVNQIGTLTETLDAVDLAHRHGYRCMMSHRSGETEDTTIADLAVATNCGQIKTGAPARSERVAKYNQLLRIEEELDDAARYAGAGAFPRYAPAALSRGRRVDADERSVTRARARRAARC